METNRTSSASIFCPQCEEILPHIGEEGDIQCYSCGEKFNPEVFEGMEVRYTIYFNNTDQYASMSKKKDIEGDEGPIVERKCPKCGNDSMSYATLQLRSADEGQTVFYTCTKCKFKETENS